MYSRRRAGSRRDELGAGLGVGLELGWGLLAGLPGDEDVFKTPCFIDQSPEVARFAQRLEA